MARFNKLSILIVGVLIVTFLSVSSCTGLVFDSMEECPRGAYIKVFSQTECAATPTYPNISRLNVYAFDEKGEFITSKVYNDVGLSADYECLFALKDPGLYSFVVWGDISDQHFEVKDLTDSKLTKESLLLTLKKENKTAVALSGKRIYVGETPQVRLEDETNLFVHTEANVRELTNRIHVTVEGVENSDKYTIELRSGNSTYAIGGDIINAPAVDYPTIVGYPSDKELVADFTTMKLQDGRNNLLVVKEKETGRVIFQEDLVGVILLSPSSNINLRCLNDFNVKLKMRHCDCPYTFLATELWINDWMIHSYDIELGQ